MQVVVSELLDMDPVSKQQDIPQCDVLEDIMYCWALAEAYLHHPEMQTVMRTTLGRKPDSRPLAAGEDGMLLSSRVQLLQGPMYEGRYMIGSVRFKREPVERSAPVDSSSADNEPSTSGRGLTWGGHGGSLLQGDTIQPALEAVFGSERARLMTSVQGDALSRMDREGAARTYHTFMYCGYFNRRMKQKEADAQASAALTPMLAAVFSARDRHDTASTSDSAPTQRLGHAGLPGAPQRFHAEDGEEPAVRPVESGYGEVAPVWRFFEQVPSNISSPRTMQAASVAQRHLRALFGSTSECITTLQSWQQMCTEARWFGRALFDAEQVVVAVCQKLEGELQHGSNQG